ncbi:MAG: glycerophosphodiester phosphodiesterase family protein [Patescibacteria group bacterium]
MLKVGHRGSAGHEPENTLRSFRRAISQGADMVECDVYRCKSGEPVVIHDPTVDRTTDGHGLVHDLTLKEMKQLNIDGSETIPTLQEVLDICRGKIQVNIEIKETVDAEAALTVVKRNNAYSWTMISSNYTKPLQQAHRLDPHLKTALIFYSTKTDARDVMFAMVCLAALPLSLRIMMNHAKKAGALWINVMRQLVNDFTVSVLKKHGYNIGVWTVNTPEEIKKMKSLGVDAIISNFPDRL